MERKDVGISAGPVVASTSTMTEAETDAAAEAASHTVHPGPNIKYDVVVHQEVRRSETNTTTSTGVTSTAAESISRPRVAVEKPPRRSRESRSSSAVGSMTSNHLGQRDSTGTDGPGGKDSMGRGAGSRLRHSLVQSGRATPTGTPRSSPAPSMSARVCATRSVQQEASGGRSTPLGRNGSGATGRVGLGRRDSLKTSQVTTKGNSKTSSGSSASGAAVGGGQHKVRSRGASFLGRWFNILE